VSALELRQDSFPHPLGKAAKRKWFVWVHLKPHHQTQGTATVLRNRDRDMTPIVEATFALSDLR
jgi:hypothetical protein